MKGQFEIFNSLKENGFENLATHRFGANVTISEVYSKLFFRIPVTEERSAGEASFDMMVEGLNQF